jgi:LAO/AO transport system kinase
VVNKGDRPGADRAARQLRAMLSTAGGRVERKPPPVLVTTATSGEGVDKLVQAIDSHQAVARSPDQARARARNQVKRALSDAAWRNAEANPEWGAIVQSVADRELDPITAAEQLLEDRD